MAPSPDLALEDLRVEARRLSPPPPRLGEEPSTEEALTEATTTLLVCPHVPEWVYFDDFHHFYSEKLGNGDALMKEFGLKVVAFHPGCESASGDLQVGDEVAVQGPEESLLLGRILDAEAGEDEEGMDLLAVQLSGTIMEEREGEEGADLLAVQPFPGGERIAQVRLSDIVWQLSSSSGREDGALDLENPSDCRSLVARSPRPVLHLIRARDLAEVGDERREGVLADNERRVRELGVEGIEELLHSCA